MMFNIYLSLTFLYYVFFQQNVTLTLQIRNKDNFCYVNVTSMLRIILRERNCKNLKLSNINSYLYKISNECYVCYVKTLTIWI